MGKSSKSTSANSTEMADNRLVVGEGGFGVGTGGYAALDARSNVTVTNADAARITELNNALLRGVSTDQTDATKAIAAFGADTINRMGGAFTDVATVSAANSARASEHMLDATEGVIGKLLDTVGKTSDSAQALANTAIASYQPADSKMGDAFKYGAIAAAVLVVVSMLKGK